MKGKAGRKPVLPPLGGVDDPDSLYQHMQRYLMNLGVRGQSQHTVASSKVALTRFIRWCEERSLCKPSEIDRPTVERFEQFLFYHRKTNGEPLTARSRQFLLIPMRLWFRWLVKQGYLPYSPASELELPKAMRSLPKVILSAQEAETVLAVPDVNTAVGLRDRAMLETLYSTGIRRMELSRLSIQDVDRDRGTLMIREGKGKKDRMIPIGERALAWIAAYRDRARPELMGGQPDNGTLFLNNLGNPLKPPHLTTLTKKYITKAGIGKEGACHLFRHTCATVLLEGGMDTRYIQAILGHASLESTQIYTRVAADALPIDLKSLEDARNKVAALQSAADKAVGEISRKLEVAKDQLDIIVEHAKESDRLVAKCDEAYKITTTVGLAASFDQRRSKTASSMWVWVVGLLAALGLGAWQGAHRLELLAKVVTTPGLGGAAFAAQLVTALISIGAPMWFAWIATKQIGQRFRLSEDYAFKAAVAKAYEGYRKEAVRIDPEFEKRLFASALTRLEEAPLRLVEAETHGRAGVARKGWQGSKPEAGLVPLQAFPFVA